MLLHEPSCTLLINFIRFFQKSVTFYGLALTFQEKNTLFPLFCLVHIAKYPTFAKVNSNKNNKITENPLTLSYFQRV